MHYSDNNSNSYNFEHQVSRTMLSTLSELSKPQRNLEVQLSPGSERLNDLCKDMQLGNSNIKI